MKKFGTNVARVPLEACLLCLALMLLTSSGCSSLKADVPFAYTPSLRMGQAIEGKAVFLQIQDVRPKKDRRSTREIPDCADKLTSKLVEDFRSTRLFSDLEYSPSRIEADFIITGRLEKFSWNTHQAITSYIPVVSLIHLLGFPYVTSTGEAQLTLEVQAGETASPRQYAGSAKNKTSYSYYEFKNVERGVELQYALRDAVKQIKEQITKDSSLRSPGG